MITCSQMPTTKVPLSRCHSRTAPSGSDTMSHSGQSWVHYNVIIMIKVTPTSTMTDPKTPQLRKKRDGTRFPETCCLPGEPCWLGAHPSPDKARPRPTQAVGAPLLLHLPLSRVSRLLPELSANNAKEEKNLQLGKRKPSTRGLGDGILEPIGSMTTIIIIDIIHAEKTKSELHCHLLSRFPPEIRGPSGPECSWAQGLISLHLAVAGYRQEALRAGLSANPQR